MIQFCIYTAYNNIKKLSLNHVVIYTFSTTTSLAANLVLIQQSWLSMLKRKPCQKHCKRWFYISISVVIICSTWPAREWMFNPLGNRLPDEYSWTVPSRADTIVLDNSQWKSFTINVAYYAMFATGLWIAADHLQGRLSFK